MQRPESAVIACTLDLQAMGARLADIGRLTKQHLLSHRLDGRTLLLTYDRAAVKEVERIVDLERECCAFLDFRLDLTADGVELSITAPGQAGSDAQWLFAQFLPQGGAPNKASGCAGGGN